ncbi:MAG: cysteine desulfurase NifS [Kiritimatiellae bacterium]|nr:cysteine desulfurase NifS [Kiritimatiellia bacterium]
MTENTPNIYLDNNATTQVAPEVIEAMMPCLQRFWGNPSSMHTFGGKVKKCIDHAREQVAALIHAHPEEIIFTSCGSESNNMALRGVVDACGGRTHIVTSNVEHPAIRSLCHYLKKLGCGLTELAVDNEGLLAPEQVAEALTKETGIVSLMWANNETGVLFPIEEIAPLVKSSGKLLHTDAVQAAGKIPIDVREVPVDMLSISGHKLHAPKGIGVLYLRKGVKINPFIIGGHQELGRRAGTENVPYIMGLGRACELALEHMNEERTRVAALRDQLEQGILASCADTFVNGNREKRLPNTTNIAFKYIEGESILLRLDQYGIAASSGSACTSGSPEPSHVMQALHVDPMALHGGIRFSLSRYNTQEEMDETLKHLPGIVDELRKLSPFTARIQRC